MTAIEHKSEIPINQQRKESIRAKYPPADQPPGSPPSPETLAVALNRMHILQPMQGPSSKPDLNSNRVMLSQFPLPRPQSSSGAESARRQAGYVQEFMQQRHMHPLSDAADTDHVGGIFPSKPVDSLSGGRVVNLKASTREAVLRDAAAYVAVDDIAGYEAEVFGDGLSPPLRPNQVTVTVPKTNLAEDVSRSGNRMDRMSSYLNSRMW